MVGLPPRRIRATQVAHALAHLLTGRRGFGFALQGFLHAFLGAAQWGVIPIYTLRFVGKLWFNGVSWEFVGYTIW